MPQPIRRYLAPFAAITLSLLSAAWLTACPFDGGRPSLERQAAQLLMLGFRGKTVAEAATILADIRERRIGGVIIYDRDVALATTRNVESPEQLATLIDGLQTASGGRLLVAIDQEGGLVNRLKTTYGFPPTHSAQYFGDLNDPAATRAEADQTAALLRSLGINLNFAPVVDLNVNPQSPAIGAVQRSYSADPGVVVTHASQVIQAHRAHGVRTALKHFPGHGSASADSHLGFTDVTQSWSATELEPYRWLVADGLADLVMTAHIYNAQLDAEYPATLSRAVMTGLLREEIGFRGVIVSDDMQMGAITQYHGLEQALELSLNAGVDLLIFANNLVYEPDIGERAVEIIVRLVEQGRVPKARLREAHDRVCGLKRELGLKC
ncbi:MAG: glycoside hydrolase family 3 N-terminal domain-containing protein [Chromatiales bacterium]|nr:glycoside hydrolase family 3 N-terminal domain-containing protein [Chromatiales bacterium]